MSHERAIPVPATLEFRSEGNGHHLSGYAAVFNSPSEPMPYTEIVDPGAFIRSLAAPPNGRQTLVVDHDDGLLLASTKTDRLHLAEDSKGLLVEGDMVDTTYARDLRELSDAGELGGMSFEFSATKGGAPFSADGKKRHLKEVRLYHVTVLTGKTPAYTETTAAVRALANGIEAEFDQVTSLLDAIREGRRLTPEEWGLLSKATATLAPEGSLRYSSAAWDASASSFVLGQLLELLGNETDDETQATLLRTAIEALQAFITAESAEVGSEADILESNALPGLEAAKAILEAPLASQAGATTP